VAFVRSALLYLAGFAAAAVLAAVLLGAGRPRANALDENRGENLAMAAWIVGITSVPAAVGFAAVACASRSWRELSARAAVPIAAACGALGYVGWLTGIGVAAGFAIPFPFGGLGTSLRLVLPGALLGALAAGAAIARRPRSAESA
jgi:hypothetical protein